MTDRRIAARITSNNATTIPAAPGVFARIEFADGSLTDVPVICFALMNEREEGFDDVFFFVGLIPNIFNPTDGRLLQVDTIAPGMHVSDATFVGYTFAKEFDAAEDALTAGDLFNAEPEEDDDPFGDAEAEEGRFGGNVGAGGLPENFRKTIEGSRLDQT